VIRRPLLGFAILMTIAGLAGLGVWQLQRRAWKLDLIDRVEARLAAAPVPAPGPTDWNGIERLNHEYARVHVSGTFRHQDEVAVLAVTEMGSGYWVVTPLDTPGFTVLVNRGFVPREHRDPATRPEDRSPGVVTVEGLLRFTEPGGGFLRANDPATGRWYSRDVAAIAEARGLDQMAPYFIDAGAAPGPGTLPVGGLTVVRFRNTHLVYALTWFALAAGLAILTLRAIRRPRGD
jgi:surfeit locus 1 family protein